MRESMILYLNNHMDYACELESFAEDRFSSDGQLMTPCAAFLRVLCGNVEELPSLFSVEVGLVPSSMGGPSYRLCDDLTDPDFPEFDIRDPDGKPVNVRRKPSFCASGLFALFKSQPATFCVRFVEDLSNWSPTQHTQSLSKPNGGSE